MDESKSINNSNGWKYVTYFSSNLKSIDVTHSHRPLPLLGYASNAESNLAMFSVANSTKGPFPVTEGTNMKEIWGLSGVKSFAMRFFGAWI